MEDIKEKTADYEDMTKMFIGCDKLEPLPKTADERDNIINDLNAIAYTRPYFSGIIAKTTSYIIELEQENKELIYKYHKALDQLANLDHKRIHKLGDE
jgi:uncharacterized protein Yka (UPF0111/DUF47 family)